LGGGRGYDAKALFLLELRARDRWPELAEHPPSALGRLTRDRHFIPYGRDTISVFAGRMGAEPAQNPIGMNGRRVERNQLMPSKSSNIKNEKQYDKLKDKGMSKERAAKIANSPDASKNGGKKSGSGGDSSQGGTTAQKKKAGRKGGKSSSGS
jgi:hypothetical protein